MDKPQDLSYLRFGESPSGEAIQITVPQEALSFLFYIQTENINEDITLLNLRGPNQKILYQYDPKTEEYTSETLYDTIYNPGEVAVYLPLTPSQKLVPGEYTFTFKTASGAPFTRSGAIFKLGPLPKKQAIDLTFWAVSNDPIWHNPRKQKRLIRAFRRQVRDIIGDYPLELGQLEFKTLPPDMVERYHEIQPNEDDEIDSDICRQLAAKTTNPRQVNVALLDKILLTQSEIENDEGATTGFSPGVPGVPPIKDSLWSCVLVNLDDTYLMEQGSNLWHEISHMLGLYHTSEADGSEFDPLSDTPECPAETFDINEDDFVDAEECENHGSENYMFWEGNGQEMTSEQAWVLQRHPLFYPVKAE